MRGIASEALLTIGVLIAVGVSLLQLKGVFYGQQRVAKEEVVFAFAEDLQNIINEARTATGNVSFVYYPSIKEYVVEVKGNVVRVYDKVSEREITLVMSGINLQRNVFEDSKVVYIVKQEDKVYILGECKDVGEECFSSLSCCSGYCWGTPAVCQERCAGIGEEAVDAKACCSGFLNETTGKCEKAPFCPKERVCKGAPEAVEVSGVDCCPEGFICSNGHCCPEGTKWCENPKPGYGKGCMSVDQYEKNCIVKKYHLVFVPLNYAQDEYWEFMAVVEDAFSFWLSISPFRECKDIEDRVEVHVIDPKDCQVTCREACFECMSKALQCVLSSPYRNVYDKVVAVCKGMSCNVCLTSSCCGCAPLNPGMGGPISVSNQRCEKLKRTVSHEMGHSFGLCHVDACGAEEACLPNCPNKEDCNEPDKEYFMMGYCPYRNVYGPAAYGFLRDVVFKDYLVGC